MDSAKNERARLTAVQCATAILNGELGLLEGCQRLADLADSLVDSWLDDRDFVLFGGVASEADGLPLGTARQYWSAEAFEREDRDIARYEAAVGDQVRAACRNVLARFSEKPSASV